MWAVSGSLKKVLDYAENPEKTSLKDVLDYASDKAKTDKELFVTGINCEAANAYKDKLTVLQYALEQYTNADENDIPESVIEAFVVKIVAKKDGFDWYLRFDGDPNDPLHMKTEGKKRKNSKVLVIRGSSPNKQNCTTDSY